MSERPLLYLAAPYTRDDPVENTSKICRVADHIYQASKWVPVIPHLTLLWHLVSPHPVDFWYDYDLHLLRRCDAIVRLPGLSTGADREMKVADSLGLEVVLFEALPAFARVFWGQHP